MRSLFHFGDWVKRWGTVPNVSRKIERKEPSLRSILVWDQASWVSALLTMR